jgi:CO dehydrogenase maturation factor
MGRPEGPGCYCYANNVLKEVLARTASQYPCVVLDNEAGLENLSRRIVQKVDLLIFAADPSSQGMRTVERLHGLAKEMGVEYRALAVVVNRIPPEAAASSVRVLDGAADIVIGLPEDPELARLGREGGGLWPLAFDNPVMQGLGELLTLAGVCEPTRGSSR